jgi:hypothetical protein
MFVLGMLEELMRSHFFTQPAPACSACLNRLFTDTEIRKNSTQQIIAAKFPGNTGQLILCLSQFFGHQLSLLVM